MSIDNNQVSWAANHIRIISKGSCDTEDWHNDAENLALITEINYSLLFLYSQWNQLFQTVIFHSYPTSLLLQGLNFYFTWHWHLVK